MIKVKPNKHLAKETILDKNDNALFEINYNGYYIDFVPVDGFQIKKLTADEQDIILCYLYGLKLRYSYQFNPETIYNNLILNQTTYTC